MRRALEVLESSCASREVAWLRAALEGLESEGVERRLRVAFAKVGRALARSDVAGPDGEPWRTHDWARWALLHRALEVGGDAAFGSIDILAQTCEMHEQCSLLRVLPYLPQASRWVPMAAEACRSNIEDVFCAIACENPFPAAAFPDLAFDQMVLKAMFLGVPVTRIRGLASRVTGELVRMARDYGAERAAAGRSIPDDIGLLESMLEAHASR